MAYDARVLLSHLASARRCARKTQTPYHLIDQAGELHAVRTVAPSDKVVVANITAPRITAKMIEVSVEAEAEMRKAMVHITRAMELVQASDTDHNEVFADLLYTAESWKDEARPAGAKRSFFARIFGGVAY
jgi:hypothetical protein